MAKKKRVVSFLRTYRFLPSEKDPVIDQVHTLMQDEESSIAEIHELSGIAKTTLYNWFDGPTRRPQWATVSAVLGALGYRAAITPMSGTEKKSVRDGKTVQAEAPRVLFKQKMPTKARVSKDQISSVSTVF